VVVVAGKPSGAQIGFEAWLSRAASTLEAAATSKDDACFWLYSSGSTGFPKGVVHLQHDMVVCSDTYALQVLGITESDRTFSAGEALPEELYKRWRDRFGVEILDGIGTTEILHIFLSNRPGQARPGSPGLAVPGYEARIVDDEGRLVPAGEIGNLRVKGDSTMAYYWNQHEKTKATLFGEWIQTGDKYYQDKDGYFWYCGRADDMLKVGGIWVSPVEVENTLVGHAAVLEAAVVGHEDTDRLVKPKAFVVLKDGHAAAPGLEDELKSFVKDKLAPYKYPRWIEFVPALPKTATGKIQRFKLR